MTAGEARRIGGRYEIEQILGRGGMATVHRARDTQLERAVAVKVMRPDLASDSVFEARFVNEARNAASISHPNVVTVLDFGTDGPGSYLVMELVEGGDLSKLLAREGPLSPHRAASIAAEVASALQAAHGHGIVHRDVKPGNILLAADGHPRVADFGIARATGGQSLTGTGTSLGSVDYFSPEQARGEPATASSDVYALGVVLYEMLTGARPFAGETQYAVAVARVETPPPDPRAVRRGIPRPLAAIVQQAMATDPVARFESAGDMGRTLETWLGRHPAPAAETTAAVAAASAAAGLAAGARTGSVSIPRAATRKTSPPTSKRLSPKKRPVAAMPAAVSAAAAADTMPIPVQTPAAAPASLAPIPVAAEDSRRRRTPLLLAAAVVLLAIIGFAGGRLLGGGGEDSSVIVGEPRGEVFGSTPEPTEQPTQRPTAEPTDPTPEPTVRATPAPIAAAPIPATPSPPRATPAPTPIAVAMAVTPDQTVATWYSYVESGQFDAAYALWSDRMRSNFPREGNLDNRWRDAADVAIQQIYVTQQSGTYANVFIDFVETKDNGSSRRFVGSWDLVRSGDHWLLDNPNF